MNSSERALVSSRPGMPCSVAFLAGWLVAALVNLALIAVELEPPESATVRLLHYAYAFGYCTGIGLLVAWVVEAWRRWGPRKPAWGYLATWLVALLLALWMIPEDVDILAGKLATYSPITLTIALFVIGTASGIPIAVRVARSIPWLWMRGIMVGIAIAAFVTNHYFATHDYPGMHFFISWERQA